VALALLFLTPLLHNLPRAVLAAIVIVAVAGLVDTQAPPHPLAAATAASSRCLLATFAATLTLGITTGLALGVLALPALFILRTTRPHTAVLGRLPNTTVYRNRERFPDALPVPGLISSASTPSSTSPTPPSCARPSCASSTNLQPPVRAVILDASSIHDIDVSALTTLREVHAPSAPAASPSTSPTSRAPSATPSPAPASSSRARRDHFSFTVHEAVQRALGVVAASDPRAVQASPA
jgi:SulP family sulfate permease